MASNISRYSLLAALATALISVSVACGGGSSGSPPLPNARNAPPQATHAPTTQAASQAVPLNATNTPIPLAPIPGISATLSLPANDAPAGARLTVIPSDTLAPWATQLTGNVAVLESFTVLASDDVTFNHTPSFTLNFSSPPPNRGTYFAWIFNSLTGWSTYSTTVTVSGNTLSVGGASQVGFTKGIAYDIAIVTGEVLASCPTPTPRPSATPITPTSAIAKPPSIAFFELAQENSPTSFSYFVDAFKNGDLSSPAYTVPLPGFSGISAAPNGTLLAHAFGTCDLLTFAPGSTSGTTITVPGCAEVFTTDALGNVYAVTNSGSNIVELQTGNYGTVLRTLSAKPGFKFHVFPDIMNHTAAMAADRANNFYAVEYADANVLTAAVDEFGPSGTSPIRSFSLDNYPTQIAVDSTGEIYAGATIDQEAVLGYPAASTVANVIVPVFGLSQIGIDSQDHLYVGWFQLPSIIDEYAPRSNERIARATIALGENSPMAIDPNDNIWSGSIPFPVLVYPSLTQVPAGFTTFSPITFAFVK